MAKTIQEQYNQIKKGKGSKEIFLKEVKRNYPHMVVNSATFKQAEEILLQRSVLSENIGGVATQSSKKPNWFKIFDDNMEIIKEENKSLLGVEGPLSADAKKDESIKADVKAPNKDVVELETKGFDYKDKKNIDNLNGEEFRLGLKFEMDKVRETVSDADLGEAIEKAKKLVAKNLASDPLYYIKNAMFGVDGIGYTDEVPGLTPSKSDKMEKVKLKENKMISLLNILESGPLGEKPKSKAKKVKKETLETKLAEIDKQSQIVALETKIATIDEVIESKNNRISMVTEDDNLSELVDKSKMKAMQKEVKILEKRKLKMEKLYEKMCGKAYKKEIVDESDAISWKRNNGQSADYVPRKVGQEKFEEQSNQGSNENSNDNSDDNSNLNSNGITER